MADQPISTTVGRILVGCDRARRTIGRARMADFAIHATAAEGVLGLETGAFMAAYHANREDATGAVLEASTRVGRFSMIWRTARRARRASFSASSMSSMSSPKMQRSAGAGGLGAPNARSSQINITVDHEIA